MNLKSAILILSVVFAKDVELPNKTVVHIDFDLDAQLVEFIARVQENSYLALGFGSTMENTSMILW
jgi:hypothetical protein